MKEIFCPLQKASKNSPEKIAIISGSLQLTYEQIDKSVQAISQYLKSINITAQTKVAVYATNSPSYIILLLALWRNHAMACLLNTRIPCEGAIAQFKELQCSHIFTDQPQNFDAVVNPKYIVNLEEMISFKSIVTDKLNSEDTKYLLDQDAVIMYTSGSTGKPKAAILTYGNLWTNALGSNEFLSFSKDDAWLLSLPLYHVGGLSIVFRFLLAQGKLVIPTENENLDESILRYEMVTHLSLVSTQLYRLLQKKEVSLRLARYKVLLLGGGPVQQALLEQAREYQLPIYITYGLTEAASQVATSKKIKNSEEQKAKILSFQKVKISSAKEILIQGECVFKGYWENGKLNSSRDEAGWYKTGDIGEIVEEEYLKVIGRKDNMFISGGENIQPEEI
ncbi:MAG: AMP-binding protein, partial [Candidatus Omnitrophica bacterium]|nr:AMP-binding protein [Candidatus Omnitrophota bacterium]